MKKNKKQLKFKSSFYHGLTDAVEINYTTFVSHIYTPDLQWLKSFLGYSHKQAYNQKISLGSDINASFWRATFRGKQAAYYCTKDGKNYVFF